MKTKDKVLQSALELFIDHGYHGTSIKLIVEESGVSTGSVYHHFTNKEEIIRELYSRTKKHMNEQILSSLDYSSNIRTLLWEYWCNRINFNTSFPKEAQFIKTYFNLPLIHSESLEAIHKMYDAFQIAIKKAMSNKEIIELDLEYFIYDLFNNCDTVSQYIALSNGPIDEDFHEMAFRKYWRSIVKLDL